MSNNIRIKKMNLFPFSFFSTGRVMAYIEDRIVHDADAHTMETPDWLKPFSDPDMRDAIQVEFDKVFFGPRNDAFQAVLDKHDDAAFRADDEAEFMARKNHLAMGSFRKEDRSRAVDLLGVEKQLVFPTTSNVMMERLENGDDIELLYAMARASNRAQIDFCSVDDRLLPVRNNTLADPHRAPDAAAEANRLRAAAPLMPCT